MTEERYGLSSCCDVSLEDVDVEIGRHFEDILREFIINNRICDKRRNMRYAISWVDVDASWMVVLG